MKTITLIVLLTLTIVMISCGDNNEEILEYSGTIESTDYVVSSQSQGMVKTLFYDKGDFVNKGDTLAIINHEKLDLQYIQLNAAKNGLLIQLKMLKDGARREDKKLANESFKQAKANFEIAESNKKRMDILFEKESITKKQYDDATLAYDVAKSMFNSAKQNVLKTKSSRPELIEQLYANIEQTDASIMLIQKSINDCYILSPIDGQIVNRFVEKSEIKLPIIKIMIPK